MAKITEKVIIKKVEELKDQPAKFRKWVKKNEKEIRNFLTYSGVAGILVGSLGIARPDIPLQQFLTQSSILATGLLSFYGGQFYKKLDDVI